MQQAPKNYVIAVDGGGSGCRALVGDARGQVLGRGAAGPANATTDLPGAIRNADLAIAQARADAGLDAAAPVAAHLGLAGALTAEVRTRVAEALGLPDARVTDDLETMAAGALGGEDGVLIAVGTGSVLAAVRAGRLHRVGGWGLQVSDQASGAWLGRTLLERVLLCHDGLEPHSALTRAVLAEMGGPLGIVDFATQARPSDFAGLAPRVVAATGDAQAEVLLSRGVAYLEQALRALDWRADEPVCLSGGLGAAYADRLPEAVRAVLVAPRGTALDGAFLLARGALEAAG